jgi:hypothetical protein
MPSNKYTRITQGLRRSQASIVMQFRSGHIVLNKYLHRITKGDTPQCPSCRSEEESVHHYLFECLTWRHKRWNMGKKLGKTAKSLSYILSSKKGVEELLKFVGRTEQFKNTFGDVDPTN